MNEDRGTKGKQRQQKKKKVMNMIAFSFGAFAMGSSVIQIWPLTTAVPQLSAMATWPG